MDMTDKGDAIRSAMDRLSVLMDNDFHGFRSEVFDVIAAAMSIQAKITKSECSEIITDALAGFDKFAVKKIVDKINR